jgi:hypothetical protein
VRLENVDITAATLTEASCQRSDECGRYTRAFVKADFLRLAKRDADFEAVDIDAEPGTRPRIDSNVDLAVRDTA